MTLDFNTLLIAAMVAIPSFITSLAAWRQSARNNDKLQDVSVAIDGRLSLLLDATEKRAKVEGIIEGITREKTAAADAQVDGDRRKP